MKITVHWSNIHFSKINQKRKLKNASIKFQISSGTTKNETSQAPSSALHLEGGLGILDVDTQLNSPTHIKEALE